MCRATCASGSSTCRRPRCWRSPSTRTWTRERRSGSAGRVGEFHDYCEELLAERKASGAAGDDLVSCIARSEHDGGPVPLGMAISFIHTFVNAGETTRSLLSFIMLLLAQHPEQRRLLIERPRAGLERGRGDPALQPPQLVRVPYRHPGHRARRPAHPQGRLRRDGVRQRQPRRGHLGAIPTSPASPDPSITTTRVSATASTPVRERCSPGPTP